MILSGWIGKLVSKIGFDYKRKITAEEREQIFKGNMHGCIICTFIPWQLSNVIIGGDYTHTEMLIGGGKSIGGLTAGVTERELKEVVEHCGRYIILKPKFADNVKRIQAVSRAKEMARLGLEYDFNFSRKNNSIYCSEVIVEGYIEDLKGRYGSLIRPNELPSDTDMWEVYYTYSAID